MLEPASRRFLLRLPAGLHAALLHRAGGRDLSLNEYLVRRLAGAEPHPSSETLTPLLLARAQSVAGTRVIGAILHGSWTRGEARTASDVDVLIVVDESLPLTRALYRAWDQEPITWQGRPVDVHFVHLPREIDRAGGMWCEAAIEGRLVADTSGRVEDTLINIRRAIADGRFVRKRVHGQPYWTAAA
jgi:predicted nucleotidyltransferase